MKGIVFFAYVAGFIVANTWSSILFKVAAGHSGKKAVWIYIAGNIIGAFAPLTLTLALRRSNPNVTYALCYGGAFAVLQIVSSRLFHQPLSAFQWAGIVTVGVGICLLQLSQR